MGKYSYPDTSFLLRGIPLPHSPDAVGTKTQAPLLVSKEKAIRNTNEIRKKPANTLASSQIRASVRTL
jgi:hypothetical protein